MPFSALGLTDRILQGVQASGYTTPTPIQTLTIPRILAGKDVIGCAQTGTGKTAAFVLPMLQLLDRPEPGSHKRAPRALVLAPTRELAIQVEEAIAVYGKFTPLGSTAIFGGVNMDNQIKRLQRGLDIVVATPGRLLDHLGRGTVDLSRVSILVLDEADRMFDMGFINDVRKIVRQVPAERQTLLFSATMSKEIRQLVREVQKDAETVEVGERKDPVATVAQHFYPVRREAKMELLFHILRSKQLDSVLVFSRTKHNADRITRRLQKGGFRSVAIHSNRSQAQRQRALAGFRQGEYQIMVATDIAARGLDIDGISHVINYDTPAFAEDYIHRIGRTGRASAVGDALTFVSTDEMDALRKIERFTGRSFELKEFPGFTPGATVAQAPQRPPMPATHGNGHRPNNGRSAKNPKRGKQQGPRQENQGRRRRRGPGGRPNAARPGKEQQPSQPQDWRSLVEQAESNSLGKRIRKFFSR